MNISIVVPSSSVSTGSCFFMYPPSTRTMPSMSVKSFNRSATMLSSIFSWLRRVMTTGTSGDWRLVVLPIAWRRASRMLSFSVRLASTKTRGRPSKSAPPAFNDVKPPPERGARLTRSVPPNSFALNQRARSRSYSSPLRLSARPCSRLEIEGAFVCLCILTWGADVLPFRA